MFPCADIDVIALILNDLAASFEGRNEYISRLCRSPLDSVLILRTSSLSRYLQSCAKTGCPVKNVLLAIAFCFPLFCGNYKVKTKRAGSSPEEPAIFIFGYIFYRTLIFFIILCLNSFAIFGVTFQSKCRLDGS